MVKPIKISRSGLRLYLECPRCFWLDLHHKIKRPPSYPYTLAAAVDFLVKQEFDKYREKGTLPPVLSRVQSLKSGAKLFQGEELEIWRNNFKGISYFDEELQAMLYGAVDDVLQLKDGSLAVIDYKSSGSKQVMIYDDYQKQMDTYTYILQRMGFATHSQAYFVFYLVDKTGGGFANVLPFQDEVKSVDVDMTWVEDAFHKAVKTARQAKAPKSSLDCKHCVYIQKVAVHTGVELAEVSSDREYILVEEE